MNKTKILVMGATGKTGGATVRVLLTKGFSVRALAHSHDTRSQALEQEGAEVFVGNMSDYGDMCVALDGINRAYFVTPFTPDQLHNAMNFAVAAEQSNLEHIVELSQWLSDPQHPSVATRETYLTDQIFKWIPNTTVTRINVGWFAENYMPPELLAVIAQLGIFPFPLGEGRTAPVSNEDIGRVVACILADPAPHIGKSYRPTGPELLTPQDIAATFSKILSKKVTYQNIPTKMFYKALNYMGMHPHMQTQLRHYVQDYQQGSLERDAPNNVVLDVTGQPAESFEKIARRYIEQSPDTKKGIGNKLKAIMGFLTLAATKPLDHEKYDKEHGLPKIKDPHFSKALG